jgi:glutathione S-transferase
MYQLYIANKNYSSWSLRPWLLMTQLEIAFKEHLNPFADGSNWEAFRKFSPSGKVPCLVDGNNVVWDSLAITEYLAESNATVWPADRNARAWARCAAAEMHSSFGALRDRCSMSCGIRVQLHSQPPELLKEIARLEELWTEGLSKFGGPFLAGAKFTGVDAFFAPSICRSPACLAVYAELVPRCPRGAVARGSARATHVESRRVVTGFAHKREIVLILRNFPSSLHR